MMEVSTNHLLLQMESKSFMLSIILGDKKLYCASERSIRDRR